MAPVKNVAVFRDCAAFRDDIIRRRTGQPYPYQARQDGRVRAFGELKNFSYDVVINRYFTRADLAQYRAVYIPEDPVFSDALAEELLAYVLSGGGAVIEGATAESPKLKALGLGDKEVRTLGKGRIMRFEMVMTDHFRGGGTPQAREAVAALASVGGQAPYTVESDTVDSVLQASDEGLFLGCYNPGKKAGTGKVRIAGPVKPDLFVLDVKNGTRRPFTGEFEVAVGAEQTGFYLIGDDRFTAIPETVKGVWAGAGCAVSNPNGRPVTANTDTAFRPARAVEFVSAYNGRPILIRRPREALIDCRPFCKEPDLLRRELKTDDLESWQDKNPKVMPFDREKFTA
jgi:hypothetical protein